MKYAVVEHRGKQYLAEEGQSIEIDRLALESGKKVEFKEVLLVSDGGVIEVGRPYIKGAKVRGTVEDHFKGPKLVVFKYKPKQRYRLKRGHRQDYTRVAIQSIGLAAAAKGETKAPEKKATPKTRAKAAKASAPATQKPKAASSRSKSKPAAKGKTRGTKPPAKGKSKPATKTKRAASKKTTTRRAGAAGKSTKPSRKASGTSKKSK